ncbi:hypothetical protein ACHAW5_003993 [Stephanodiscus triporus]|uniref:RING-type domain-containing protein n=1 Tax=Stephanodiscus triporus TaxID=2934178 RepID=A0ABD3MJ18_9STRA
MSTGASEAEPSEADADLSTRPNHENDAIPICPLCCDEGLTSTVAVVLSACQHRSCGACLVRWMEREESSGRDEGPTCPFCRLPIRQEDVVRILGRPFHSCGATVREATDDDEIDEFTLHWINQNTYSHMGGTSPESSDDNVSRAAAAAAAAVAVGGGGGGRTMAIAAANFDDNGNVVDGNQDGGTLGDNRDDEDMAEDEDDDESDYSYAYEDENEGRFTGFLIPTYPFETTIMTGFPPAVFAEDFAAAAVGPSPETSIANSSETVTRAAFAAASAAAVGRDQFAASKRDGFAAASTSGQSLMSMGCSGRSILSMDLGLCSQDFPGGYGSLINSGDFDYDADAYLHPEFKALQDAPLPDINAGNGMTTSEYEEPLVSLPEDQEHNPCPIVKLTAKLERCSTCESASGQSLMSMGCSGRSILSMDLGLCSQDFPGGYGSLINSGDFDYDADDDLHPEFKALQDAPLPDINAGNGMTTSEYEVPLVSLPVEPFDDDVLFGRGGFTNTHPGNITFREKALELRPWYEQSDKKERFEISKVLLESITANGYRFLERGNDGLWHEVVGNRVRRKASQALRDCVDWV